MLVDGREIAYSIEVAVKAALQQKSEKLRLRVFTCVPTFATQKFLGLKRGYAARVGVELIVDERPDSSTTDDLIRAVERAVEIDDGIILQLPFPQEIDINQTLAHLPASRDVDVIGQEAEAQFDTGISPVLPPVIGAIEEIASRYHCALSGARVVVVGAGRLVGKPAAVWFQQQGARVQVVDRNTDNLHSYTNEADILVLGAGVPGMITPDMIKQGVVIFDAGTSEDTGKLVGDADPSCAKKASLFTPVPGGIGPITLSMIFRNLLTLDGQVVNGTAK